MADTPNTREELLPQLDEAWSKLQTTIHEVEQRGHSDLTDAAGWSATDHLIHINVWLHSVIGMVRSGRPQWEGLGIEMSLYDEGDVDAMNEEIRRQHGSWSSEHIVQQLSETYQDLRKTLDGLTESDLQQPAFAYAEGGGDGPILDKIVGNSLSHFDEHRAMIDEILKQEQ